MFEDIESPKKIYNPPISDKLSEMPDLDFKGLADALLLEYIDETEFEKNHPPYHGLMSGHEGLFFAQKNDCVNLETNFALEELSYRLQTCLHQDAKKLISLFEQTKLKLITVPPEKIDSLKEKIANEAAKIAKINYLIHKSNSVGYTNTQGHFKFSETRGVLQHEIGITDARSVHPILATYGAAPCIAIAIYNRQTKVAVLANIDVLTNLTCLHQYFHKLLKGCKTTLEVHIGGGDRSTKEQTSQLIELILSYEKVKIISSDVGGTR